MVKIIGVDIETTGLDQSKGHKIIEVYAGLWTDGVKLKEYYSRYDPQRSIQAEAERVHGISLSDLVGEKTWEDKAKELHDFLSLGDLIVAHNGDSFDIPFINAEFKRIGLSEIKTKTYDTMLEGRWATINGKLPSLKELCFSCNIEYDESKSHKADYDVDVMMNSYFNGVKWNFFK